MKIQIEESWLNQKCNECGGLIYPKKVIRIRAEKGTIRAELRFCENCPEKVFSKEIAEKIKINCPNGKIN